MQLWKGLKQLVVGSSYELKSLHELLLPHTKLLQDHI